MHQIKTYNKIAQEGLDQFSEGNYELNKSDSPEGILLRSENLQDMEFNDGLLAIARAGAGVNNIPVERSSDEGIVVFNTPGSNANAVKELVIAAMITSVRNMFPAQKWMEQVEGENIAETVEANKKQFKGQEIQGKTIGVIGLGSIGHLVANDAYRLGMNVVGYDPYISVQAAWKISRHVVQADSADEVFRKADFVTVHIPYTKDTHHIIDEKAISQMKETATLMNFARNELVDIDAVVKALDDNRLNFYLTDFPDERILKREDSLTFPHLGASTEEAEKMSAIMASQQMIRYIETGEITNSVNFPVVEMPFKSPTRITIVNRNIPNMIGTLSQKLAEYKINIENFINKSRGDYAYNIVDISATDPDILQTIKNDLYQVEDIIKVRMIVNKED